jgi:enediyne biosynthesis protein E11
MTDSPDVIKDLLAEGEDLDGVLAEAGTAALTLPTPAPGWTIAHQIAHLSATFRLAALAAGAPKEFAAVVAKLSPDFDANVTAALTPYLADQPEVMIERWRTELATAVQALAAVPAGQTVPWLVRPLPPEVLASAGLMELFAHGQDIYDTLQYRREETGRLRHLVAFAVRTWDFGYLARGQKAPDTAFRFEITGPSGALWTFGPADAENRVTGPALDFCLLVTRRRHPADLAVVATGDEARSWVTIAQAYRGTPGGGRVPGQFAR